MVRTLRAAPLVYSVYTLYNDRRTRMAAWTSSDVPPCHGMPATGMAVSPAPVGGFAPPPIPGYRREVCKAVGPAGKRASMRERVRRSDRGADDVFMNLDRGMP